MRLCLFEDAWVADLEPLTFTRPVFDLLCGMTSLGDKQRSCCSAGDLGVLIRPLLADLYRLQYPETHVNDPAWLRAGPTLLVNARWLPPTPMEEMELAPSIGMIGEEIAYAVVEPDHLARCSPNTLDDCLETWKSTLPQRPAEGLMIHYPWDLVEQNAEQICLDFRTYPSRLGVTPEPQAPAVMGPASQLWIDPTAHVEPMTVADTTRGPIIIDEGAVVTAFSRLEGPCYIGPHSHVLGAKIRGGTTLGPQCRIGGEVEASIVQGRSNKYHDGFLGHSYLGEWINLGAGTQNSDLRNDYGEVMVTIRGQAVRTGLTKVGCFLGDHSKSGLGALLNTGTNAGIFCNLLPGGLLPKYLPSFTSWWNGSLTEHADLPRLLETAAVVMQRRGTEFTDLHAALYRNLLDQSAPSRRIALRDSEQRRLRRTA